MPTPIQGVDDLLWWIVRATTPLVGDEFFRMLVSHLAARLDLSVVFVAECLDRPTTRMRTLAFWDGGGLRENFEFDLRGTPCERTVRQGKEYWIADEVARLYPREGARGRRSYYGLPIFCPSSQQVIGHLACFDVRRMERDVFSDPLFHIFATRAAAELQRRHAEERAKEHLHQLAHLSRVAAMNEMASVIAHEINQPLATILTNSDTCLGALRALPGIPPELIEALASTSAEAERAAEVVRHLRAFVRKGQRCAEDTDVGALVARAADLARIEARRESVLLEVQIAPRLPPVRVDPIQIEQVVLNLIRNSIEALRAVSDGPREVHVRIRPADSQLLEISVQDTGPGIDARLAENVFEPFFSTKPSGMGVGLAICRSIVESHGGRLWLDAAAAGTTFRFSIPLARSA